MSLTSNQEAGDSYIQQEKKTRNRVQGYFCGLCATYIAKLAGVAPVTARRFLGKAKGNKVTVEEIRKFIVYHEAQRLASSIRKDIGSSVASDYLAIVQGFDSRQSSSRRA